MFAITGITGKVGGEVARTLLAAGQAVRAVLRDDAKAAGWKAQGCEINLADIEDQTALAAAFAGAEGVFILPPSEFDPEPGFPEARKVIDAIVAALTAARPSKVVCLSTIGADATHENLLTQRQLLETALSDIAIPVTFLRPAWFMENAMWDVATARDQGILQSFLQPADKAFPMVATRDVGRLAAELLQQSWIGTRIVELEGPERVSPDDLASAFGAVLNRSVSVETIPRETWEGLFRSQGMKNPGPRVRMLDGFNESWIEFADQGRSSTKGSTPLIEVISALVAQSNNSSE
ncbi:NmrA family NAD(P)-binding protein [Rhizobium sp. RCC_161_2]|uniref:NmrA family NAD(P)-binding protein n=1 Tax=Rhizobium sp. RCC_161_2 TaxID=3239219 RepID=UPI003524D5B1